MIGLPISSSGHLILVPPLFGWDDLVYTHLSMRVPDEPGHFLINPYGLFFEEITASSLVKVDHAGRPLQDSPFPVNPAGFVIHSTVHEARPEVACVMHTHTPHGVAVAAQAEGLLPLSQQSGFILNALAYHDYEGVALRDAERHERGIGSLGLNYWCRGRDSNPYASRPWNLNPCCLPIPAPAPLKRAYFIGRRKPWQKLRIVD